MTIQVNKVEQTILRGVWKFALNEPDRVAVTMGAVRYTYGQLCDRMVQISHAAHRHQLSQQRIGLYMTNHPDYLAAFLGIVQAGSIAVPLPADLPVSQLKEYQEHLGLSAVWDAQMIAEFVNVPTLTSDSAHFSEEWDRLAARIGPDTLFYMAVSSGSTGKPKGILRNHRSWVASFQAMQDAFGVGSDDVFLVSGPLHYSASLIAALQVLDAGGEVRLLPSFQEEAFLEQLCEHSVTAAFLVPAMIAKLLTYLDQCPAYKETVRELAFTVITAGAKLEVGWKQAWLQTCGQCRLFEYYGAAELSFVSYLGPDEQLTTGESVGRSFPQVDLKILDAHGNPCPLRQVGEVYVKSEMVAQGYGHQGAEAFLVPRQGYYSVGDMGFLDDAGYLFLTGRKQELILRGGVNIFPLEIEQVLHQHADIADTAVFGIPDKVLGERIIAVIVLGDQIGEQFAQALHKPQILSRSDFALHEWIKQQLPHSRWPDYYLIVEQLPLGSTGKTDKQALRKLYESLNHKHGAADFSDESKRERKGK